MMEHPAEPDGAQAWDVWECTVCLHLYDEQAGDPEHSIPPGTRFADLPDDWQCPDCGLAKQFFKKLVH